MNPEVEYRKAIASDAVAIMRLLQTYYKEQALDYPEVDENDCMEWILRVIREGISVAAVYQGRVVGSLGVSVYDFNWNKSRKYLLNEWFTVSPKCRSMGIGRELLKKAKQISDLSSKNAEQKIPFMLGVISGKDKRLDRFVEMSGFQYAGGNFAYGLDISEEAGETA